MMLAALILVMTLAGAADPIESAELPSENAVVGARHAGLTIACTQGAAVMRLRWPQEVRAPQLPVGVGRASGQDAVMAPPVAWTILAGSPGETLALSPDAAVLGAFEPEDDVLLLGVHAGAGGATAEFAAPALQAALSDVAARCR